MKLLIRTVSLLLIAATLSSCLFSCSSDKTSSKTGNTDTVSDPDSSQIKAESIGNPSAVGAAANKDSILPTISITTESGEGIYTKDYQASTISVSGASVEECNFENISAQIRCRGNFTFTGTDKKSYRLKFDEKINLFNQGSGPSKSWVLLAEHCDQSFLRNHIAFTMANLLTGISYVSSSSFVHLIINGTDAGIYHLAEQHQAGDYRININEDPEATDTDYLVEWDAYAGDSGERGLNYFEVDGNNFLVDSDSMTEEKCDFLDNYFNEAYAAIKDGKKAQIEKYIDLDPFIDMYILQETVKNIDVGWSSFFLVKSAGGKISCTCPWDFDLGFGNDKRLDDGSFENLYVGNSEYAFGWGRLDQGNEWFCYLMRQKWFVDLVVARWNEMSDKLKAAACDEIDRISDIFSDEIASNFTVWDILNRRGSINQEPQEIINLKTYPEHLAYLRSWIESRFTWIDAYFDNKDTKYATTEYEEWGGWKPWW